MAETLSFLISRRNPKSVDDYDRALREVIQEFMLLALWRAKFFEKAAFYGGTALRLLYGLDRFSEDLDFSLLESDPEFHFEPYFEGIRKELGSLGLEASLESKDKEGPIRAAFMKTNIRQALIRVGVSERLAVSVHTNRLIKVKFEADIDPPAGFGTETKLLLEPAPIGVRAYSDDCLFAGKFHALLARNWRNRVKGRDWYDLVFLVRRDIPVNLSYLASRLAATGGRLGKTVSPDDARGLLAERIGSLDIDAARDDVRSFLADPAQLDLWSREFFLQVAERIRFI